MLTADRFTLHVVCDTGMTGPVVMDYRGDRLMDYQVLFLAYDSNKFDRYMKIPLTKAARNITACVKWLVKIRVYFCIMCSMLFVSQSVIHMCTSRVLPLLPLRGR